MNSMDLPTGTELRDFLVLPYGELEDLNLRAKRSVRIASRQAIQEERLRYLGRSRGSRPSPCSSATSKAACTCSTTTRSSCSSYDNLTFDGSSIRGFTPQRESDLRLSSTGLLLLGPADVFGPGKVLVFADVIDKDGSPFAATSAACSRSSTNDCFAKEGYTLNAANEIEGFLFKGLDAERRYHETGKFEYVNTGGYYHSLPGDPLRTFIDTVAEVQRAMGFQNEKDHPEVAPSQFEINYGYGEVVAAADQIQLYKLICRQVATRLGMTASFLPKPVVGVNGSGMHTNVSVSKDGKNLFWDPKGEEKLSDVWVGVRGSHPDARKRHLPDAQRQRQRVSPARSAFRSAEPDQGLGGRSRFDGPHPDRQRAQRARRGPFGRARRQPVHGDARRLPDRSRGHDQQRHEPASSRALSARQHLRRARGLPRSAWTTKMLGEDVKARYADLKQASADRCPRLLGTFVKAQEVQYHHEVYNQYLWNLF